MAVALELAVEAPEVAEARPWGELEAEEFLDTLGGVRCVKLRLDLAAVEGCRLESFPGTKLSGALWHRLQEVVATTPDPQLRFLARTAVRLHDPVEVRSGIRARPFVLTSPAGPLRLAPGARMRVGVTLLGEAAETWPAWTEAAHGLRLGGALFRLQGARPGGADGPAPYDDTGPLGNRTPTLGLLVPPVPPEEVQRTAIRLLTPTTVEERTDFLTREGTLAVFMRGLLTRLRAVARADLARQAEREVLAAAAATRLTADETQVASVQHWSGRTNTDKEYRALIGRFEVAGPLAPLLPLLRIGELVHVGKHSAWGFGRYAVELGEPGA